MNDSDARVFVLRVLEYLERTTNVIPLNEKGIPLLATTDFTEDCAPAGVIRDA